MKRIFVLICFMLFSISTFAGLDINAATEDEIYNLNVSSRIAEKIINYIELTGGFEKVTELRRIRGIGPATYKKIKNQIEVITPCEKKRCKINSATEDELKMFGFDKKEIKKIVEYRNKNGSIEHNLEFMQIIDEDRYNKTSEIISFE